jgi:hypothetical protein
MNKRFILSLVFALVTVCASQFATATQTAETIPPNLNITN